VDAPLQLFTYDVIDSRHQTNDFPQGILKMTPQPSYVMPLRTDIVAYSPDHSLVVVVECEGGNQTSPQYAALLRRSLITHRLLPDAPYLLIASPTGFFLWLEQTPPGEPPDFSASAASVLHHYVGKLAEDTEGIRRDALQLVLFGWLADLADAIRQPDPCSEADQMLVKSGLYDKIRRGQVKFGVAP